MLILVIARLYGTDGVGVYALAQSVILGCAILSRYGMGNALMKVVAQGDNASNSVDYLIWSGTRAFFVSLICSCLILLFNELLEDLFQARGLSGVLTGIAIALPAFTLSFILSGFFKGVRKPATACLLENGAIALVSAAIIWGVASFTFYEDLMLIGYAYAISAWLVLVWGGVCVSLWYRRSGLYKYSYVSIESTDKPKFLSSSQSFFIISLAGFIQSVVGILIAGSLLTSSDLGLFKASHQSATLIGIVLIVINAVFPPKFAELHSKGRYEELAVIARKGALVGIVLSFPFLMICLVFPEHILSIFGDEFSAASFLLQLIAVAQFVNVGTGSVGFLLNMTGHERIMRNIALSCNIIGVLLFLILIPFVGVIGAAIGIAFILVAQNLVALYFVWKCLGIWTMPIPNLFQYFGVKRDI